MLGNFNYTSHSFVNSYSMLSHSFLFGPLVSIPAVSQSEYMGSLPVWPGAWSEAGRCNGLLPVVHSGFLLFDLK